MKEKTYTEKEIWDQPKLWHEIFAQVLLEKQPIISFLNQAVLNQNLNVVLTGAGTSAFIGLSLTGIYYRKLQKHVTAVSTTDMVTHPLDYLKSDVPLLLISLEGVMAPLVVMEHVSEPQKI